MTHLNKNIRQILAIASGKGGVGKSTVSFQLAQALKQQGVRVGLLDADIYGPSQPFLLQNETRAEISEDKQFIPEFYEGIPVMSIGYVVDKAVALSWRGPMASKALQQLVFNTLWPDLDLLLIDCPPGTGDIQLTLSQKIPLVGALMVTTPDVLSVIDVVKAIDMFQKVKVPVLGVVENMSTHICSECGHKSTPFGMGGGEAIARQFEIPCLGQIPFVEASRSLQGQSLQDQSRRADRLVVLESAYAALSKSLLTHLDACPKRRTISVLQVE